MGNIQMYINRADPWRGQGRQGIGPNFGVFGQRLLSGERWVHEPGIGACETAVARGCVPGTMFFVAAWR